jgi:hypothetical protein
LEPNIPNLTRTSSKNLDPNLTKPKPNQTQTEPNPKPNS